MSLTYLAPAVSSVKEDTRLPIIAAQQSCFKNQS